MFVQIKIIVLITLAVYCSGFPKFWSSFIDSSEKSVEKFLPTTSTTQRPTTTPPIHWQDPNFKPPIGPEEEHVPKFWLDAGQNLLRKQLKKNTLNFNKAKNIILLVGDGMSIATQTATRMYIGGENFELSFEKFPYTGLSKTYCVNHQVPDSACTATAILSGVKVNYGTVGVSASVGLGNCTALQQENPHISNLFKFAQDAGKNTGFVTNMRVTHATPSAVYARSADREYENDVLTPSGCEDIAKQLVHSDVGKKLKVILGGGSRNLLPVGVESGSRRDGRNLIEEWLNDKPQNLKSAYVNDKDSLLKVNKSTDYLMGLFHSSHIPYHLLGDDLYPSLTEMSLKALELLSKNDNDNGYFLFIEGGQIDQGHHDNLAQLALDETAEFHKMIEAIQKKVNTDETLIVVTADHAHTMTIGGYPKRGNDILAMGDFSIEDNMPLYTLNYANGMGYFDHVDEEGNRINPIGRPSYLLNYTFPTAVPLESETHGGDDVGVYAIGPWAHLFTGNYEQNYIAHAIMYASCLGDGIKPDIC